jgi:tellurite resistance protein TerA
MPIDYTKRPKQSPPPPPPPASAPAPSAPPPPSGPVVLTKAAPTVSLAKHTSGVLRVNLNWNARPTESRGFFKKAEPSLDLDLGCLYEFVDGSKGVVQALGNAFTAGARDVATPIIRLDGDDRSGNVTTGENLLIDLSQVARIRRIIVFALIYQGATNWAAAAGVATLYPATGQPITINLDEPREGARVCAIALLENQGGDLVVRREVNYINGGQRALDEAYGWGMRWTAGRK